MGRTYSGAGRRTQGPAPGHGRPGARRIHDGRDDGSTVVEAVLVVPILMVILLVVVQFALWAQAAQVVQLAASEGDRAACSLGGGAAAGAAEAESVTRRDGSSLRDSTVAVTQAPGDTESVAVTGSAVSIVPGLVLRVSSTEVGPIQEFRASE